MMVQPGNCYPNYLDILSYFPARAEHNGGANACMGDGHVQTLYPRQFLDRFAGWRTNKYFWPRNNGSTGEYYN